MNMQYGSGSDSYSSCNCPQGKKTLRGPEMNVNNGGNYNEGTIGGFGTANFVGRRVARSAYNSPATAYCNCPEPNNQVIGGPLMNINNGGNNNRGHIGGNDNFLG
jgi:hypothetical protein